MNAESPFNSATHYRPAAHCAVGERTVPLHFGDRAAEYRAAHGEAAMFDRSDRARLVAEGKDAQPWLHNLVTNAVKGLADGQGVYAFVLDLKGRIVFDLNMLCVGSALWLDVSATVAATALRHFDRYLFTEAVTLREATATDARLAVSGPAAPHVAEKLGCQNLLALADLQQAPLADDVRLWRHDFAGGPGFELLVPRTAGAAWWDRVASAGARPAGYAALDALRIEARIPWLGRDLDNTVLPPETGQVERGVSYNKGCYVGHEIIERMRSRGVTPRRLARVAADDGQGLDLPADVVQSGQTVGRLTSLVQHPIEPHWIGLALLKSALAGDASLAVQERPLRLLD